MNPAPLPSTLGAQPLGHLLDVNVLLAAIWANHPHHAKAFAWLSGKGVIVCPLSELGFLRISTNKKAINAPMEKARELLNQFVTDRKRYNAGNVHSLYRQTHQCKPAAKTLSLRAIESASECCHSRNVSRAHS